MSVFNVVQTALKLNLPDLTSNRFRIERQKFYYKLAAKVAEDPAFNLLKNRSVYGGRKVINAKMISRINVAMENLLEDLESIGELTPSKEMVDYAVSRAKSTLVVRG